MVNSILAPSTPQIIHKLKKKKEREIILISKDNSNASPELMFWSYDLCVATQLSTTPPYMTE